MYFRKPDVELMQKAAEMLRGTHDFTSFSSAKSDTENRICTVKQLEIKQEGDMIFMDISADRFVMNMVRTIMGTLTEVGLGKRNPESMEELLQARNRERAGENAPPEGLFLTDVAYPPDIFML
jgi:tRNA pseudouridine38-40 synthase